MSFSISRVTENDLSLVRLQDNATNTIISVLPDYSALLHSFEIPLQCSQYNIIDNYSSKEYLQKNQALSYKSSKLSPFVCRIPGGRYELEGQVFEISKKFIDGSAIHGLLYDRPFSVLNEFADDHRASISLRYHYKEDDPGYPFN